MTGVVGERAFRRDIQGIRALAVALVLLDHFRIGPFQGGFVGVDVFFVVSGYLITQLLLAEAEASGRVSLLGFYARRARRILPAATLVLIATVLGSLALLSAVQAGEVVQDALWATFFAANLKLARDGTDYFHADASTSPLQHFWSLAVEEQFYVAWPLLLLAGCGLAALLVRRRLAAAQPVDRSRAVRRVSTTLVLVLVAGSFAWSLVAAGQTDAGAATRAYFSPFARAWELGAGAMLACLTRSARRRARGSAALGWVGLGAIVASGVLYDADTGFPGLPATLPVLGAVALLASGLHPTRWGPQRLLSVAPMRHVGDWSYSIYLWHWPALVLVTEAWRRPQGWTTVAVVAGVVATSALTYRFVENPVRRSRLMRTRRLLPVLLYPTVVVVTLPTLAAAGAVVRDEVSGGGPPISVTAYGRPAGQPALAFSEDPVVALVQASIAAARNGVPVPQGLQPPLLGLEDDVPDLGRCEYYLINHRSHRPLCPRGDPEGDRTVVLIGDSHARQWIPAMDPLTKTHGYRAFYLVREGCPASDVTPWAARGGANEECAAFQDWAREEVRALHPDLVVLASDANRRGFATDAGERVDDVASMATMYRDGIEREIADVEPYAGRVVVLGDPPAVTVRPGECLSTRGATLAGCLSPESQESWVFIDALRRGTEAVGAQYVATASWFCADKVCPSVVGTFVPHRDRFHVSQPYAAYLAPELDRQLRLGGPS